MNRLRQLRTDALLTVEQLAEQTGVPKSTIWNIEAGRVRRPSIRTLERLAQRLGARPSELVPTADEARAES